jgi:hypothetical protein
VHASLEVEQALDRYFTGLVCSQHMFAVPHVSPCCFRAALRRLYRQYMAQHVLCPAYTSQKACINDTGPVTCAWNPRRQRCEADKYASFLMPMTCPGSAARAYLNCMRKPSEAACKADVACTVEHAHACLPRTMVAQAKASNSSVQAMAEQLALGVLKGAQ